MFNISRLLNISCTLRTASGTIIDGKVVYSERPGKCTLTELVSADFDAWGAVAGGKVVIFGADAQVSLPAQVLIFNKTYTLKQIRTCRDLDGSLIGFRCLVV